MRSGVTAGAATGVDVQAPPGTVGRARDAVVRALLTSRAHRLAGDRMIVLHLVGRRTGRRYDVPVGRHEIGGRAYVLTHGRWRANLHGGAPVEITHRGVRRPGRGVLLEDPDQVAGLYRDVIGRLGPVRAGRQLGLRLPGGTAPTRDQLRDAVRTHGLAAVELDGG